MLFPIFKKKKNLIPRQCVFEWACTTIIPTPCAGCSRSGVCHPEPEWFLTYIYIWGIFPPLRLAYRLFASLPVDNVYTAIIYINNNALLNCSNKKERLQRSRKNPRRVIADNMGTILEICTYFKSICVYVYVYVGF